jgi:hypothetical protein
MKTNLITLTLALMLAAFANAQETLNGSCGFLHDTTQIVLPNNALYKAGSCNSHNGFAHTPKGNLHIPIIYVGFNDETTDVTDWPHNAPPNYANGVLNELIDANPNAPSGLDNLSKWYREMSMQPSGTPKFTLTGKVFFVKIDKAFINGQLNFFTMYSRAIEALESKYPNYDWSEFDQRKNNPRFAFDNSQFSNTSGSPAGPDGIIDYLVINFRLLNGSNWTGGAATWLFSGIRNLTTTANGGKTYSFDAGHTAHFMTPSKWHHDDYFKHEFSHVLFNAPHYMGANSLVGNYLYHQRGWGMMSETHKIIGTTNAWEEYWLGWIEPRQISTNGTYQLGDFVRDNDVIRIQIPNTSQYLWIENHQKVNAMDRKVIGSNENMGAGIYLFVTARGNDCENPLSFDVSNSDNTNSMKVLSAKGNYDYDFLNNGSNIVFNKTRENPISGQNDLQGIRKDYIAPKGSITVNNHFNNQPVRNEQNWVIWESLTKGSIPIQSNATFGTVEDSYVLGDNLGINGVIPLLNYPKYDLNSSKSLEPFLLNGLQIVISNYNNITGVYTLNIQFDNNQLTKNTQWSGNLILKKQSTSSVSTDLILKSGTELRLNRGNTVNTHLILEDDSYTFPSVLNQDPNVSMKIERGASYVIEEKSTHIINNNSLLFLDVNSTVLVKSDGKLMIKQGGTIDIRWGSKLILEGGSLIVEQGANINLQDLESVIEIRDGGKIILGTNANFKWTGTGYIKVNTTTKGVSNILASGPNAIVDMTQNFMLQGGRTRKVIEVTNGSLSVDKSVAKFALNGGTVLMGPQTMLDVEAPMHLVGVKINTLLPNTKFSGIYVYGQQNTAYLQSCVIDNADVGLRVFSIKGTATKALVTGTNFNSCNIGVLVYGKSAEISGGSYWNNKTGISLEGTQFTSNIDNINSRGNRSAIDIVGSGTDIVNLREVHIRSNSSVGAFVINSKLIPTCSRMYNNYSNNNMAAGSNILLREYAYLDIEPYGAKDGGRNELTSAFSPSVVCQNASGFALNDGRSDFNTPSPELSFKGTLLKLPNNGFRPTVMALNNYWKTPSSAPIQFTDYAVAYPHQLFTSPINLTIDGSTPLAIPSDRSDCNLPIVLPDIPKKPSAFLSKTSKPLGDGTPIDKRFMGAVAKLHGNTPNYQEAITDFLSIVNHPFSTEYTIVLPLGQTVSEFDQWYDVIELSYKKAMEAFGRGIAEGSILVSDDIAYEIVAAQTVFKNYYLLNPNAIDHYYQIRLDEALIYRLIDKRELALEEVVKLKAEITDENAPIVPLVGYYECLLTNELFILNTEDKLAYTSIDECRHLLDIAEAEVEVIGERPEDPIWQEGYGKTEGAKNEISTSNKSNEHRLIEAISSTIEVYPNPASNLIYLKLPMDMNVTEINIKDITGRLVGNFVQTQNTGVVSVPVNIDNGTYFIELIDAQKVIARKKIVIVK